MAGSGGAWRAWPRGWNLTARAALALVIVFVLAGSWPTAADAQASAITRVTLHSAGNYGGASWSSYTGTASLVGFGFNDLASSITVPAGGRVAVFEHTNYLGLCEDIIASDPDLRGNPIGDDRISSLQVGKACPPRATLYADRNYGGAHRVLFTTYQGSDALEGFDNIASSIHVTGGLTVTVYDWKASGSNGACTTFTAGDPDLSDNHVGEDRVSYAIVRDYFNELCMP